MSDPFDLIRAADEARKGPPMEPCRVCGEFVTPNGQTCERCERNLEEERDR